MAKETVLIVEDERDIMEMIAYNLRRDGYQVREATTGESALQAVKAAQPDIMLLDLMLPGLDGLEVCRRLKREPKTEHMPIIMLTAKGDESDVVAGLELGADDYLTKPFSPKVLGARIKAVLRRKRSAAPGEHEPVVLGELTIHPGKHEATVDGVPVHLTQTEFRILHTLARRPGWVFSRYQIVDAVHGSDHDVTDRSVDVQIVALRKKLGDTTGKRIETVRGVGYRLRD